MLFKKKEEKCKYAWGDYKCSRPALTGDERCFFHSEDIERKKDKFNEEFWKKEFKNQKKDKKKYDFTGFVFPGDIQFKELEFEKDVCFGDTTFCGKVDFLGAKFSGKADFKFAMFFGKFNIFSHTKFSKFADFGNAEFLSKAGETYFTGAVFFENAIFNSFRFCGNVSFREAKFYKRAEFQRTCYIDEDVNNLYFEYTYFFNVRGLFEFIEENKKKFKYSKKPKLEFLPENFRLILGEESTARYPIISRKIRDDMYLLSFKKKHPKIHFIWWLFADCGRSFLRWAFWSLVIAFLFGLIYTPCFDFFPNWWIDLCNKIGPQFEQTSKAFSNQPPGFWSSLYFSIVTFTTLGFGDIVAANITARILVTIEVILGYIMLGGLISILANKLARRS